MSNLAPHGTLGHPNVLASEKQLPIQVGYVDGIQINDFNMSKTTETKIFEQFATNTTAAE
jgi:hypothetical protein